MLRHFQVVPTQEVFQRFQVAPVCEVLADPDLLPHPPNVARALERLVTSLDPPAKTVIIEHDYIDVDHSASYYDQRARSFTPVERGTTWVHFFSEEFADIPPAAADAQVVETMQSSYLGFTVLRPETPVTLGRTFITCPTTLDSLPVNFPTRGTTSVDLAGISLEVESCPYMSQDAKIMACATAAIWMSTSNLFDKIANVAAYTTAEITTLAMSLERPFGPRVGQRGLTDEEMERALFRMGFEPQRHEFPSADRLMEICHLCSDSGIPPVLVILLPGGWHAVTVVGYTWGPSSNQDPTVTGMLSAHRFVPYLVIHDDQRGMYLRAEVQDVQTTSGEKFVQLTIYAPEGTADAGCKAILVPFPRRVMLDALDIRAQAEIWIPQAKKIRAIDDRPVVYRKILVRSNAYKQTLLANQVSGANADGYPVDLVDFARALPMPRYVWLIEVSYADQWDPLDPKMPPVVAEWVLDSTSTEPIHPDFLLAHVPNTVMGNRITESGIEPIRIDVENDQPHAPFPNTARP